MALLLCVLMWSRGDDDDNTIPSAPAASVSGHERYGNVKGNPLVHQSYAVVNNNLAGILKALHSGQNRASQQHETSECTGRIALISPSPSTGPDGSFWMSQHPS